MSALLLIQCFVAGFGMGFMAAVLIDVFWMEDRG